MKACKVKFLINAVFAGNKMNDSMFEDIMKELPALISESDLHVSQVSPLPSCYADCFHKQLLNTNISCDPKADS